MRIEINKMKLTREEYRKLIQNLTQDSHRDHLPSLQKIHLNPNASVLTIINKETESSMFSKELISSWLLLFYYPEPKVGL